MLEIVRETSQDLLLGAALNPKTYIIYQLDAGEGIKILPELFFHRHLYSCNEFVARSIYWWSPHNVADATVAACMQLASINRALLCVPSHNHSQLFNITIGLDDLCTVLIVL